MNFIEFEKLEKKWMKEPEFRKGYEEMKPGFEFAEILISKRMEKGLTQGDLAERLGTTQSAVSRMESGDYNPSLELLNRIAKAFNSEVKITLK